MVTKREMMDFARIIKRRQETVNHGLTFAGGIAVGAFRSLYDAFTSTRLGEVDLPEDALSYVVPLVGALIGGVMEYKEHKELRLSVAGRALAAGVAIGIGDFVGYSATILGKNALGEMLYNL